MCIGQQLLWGCRTDFIKAACQQTPQHPIYNRQVYDSIPRYNYQRIHILMV